MNNRSRLAPPAKSLAARSALSVGAALSIGVALTVVGCGGKKAASEPPAAPVPLNDLAGKFIFEPKLGTTFRHTLRRTEEMQIVDTPVHTSEEWEATFDTAITTEANLYRYDFNLVGMKVTQSGEVIFDGNDGRIAEQNGHFEMVLDHYARVLEIRGVETLTQALVTVAKPENKEAVARMFNPRMLQGMFAVAVGERTADLLGQSARVGNSWENTVKAQDGSEPVAKKLWVEAAADCGQERCVLVKRELRIQPELVWEAAEARVKGFVERQGGDPAQVRLIKAEVENLDQMTVNSRTMEFHGATFEQNATITVEGPKGPLTVKLSKKRESVYSYER